MNLNLLDEPFEARDIEWRTQQCGISNNKPWAMVLAYVTNRAIMKRLDEVCGKGGWKNEYKDIPGGGVECGISIKIDGEWVTKWDAADKTNMEATKGGRSGAMKRAAVQWGIGRYLYDLESGFANCSIDRKNGHDWKKAMTKDKKVIYWQIPTLPAWALPKQKSENTSSGCDNSANQEPVFDFDEALKKATSAISSADLATLKVLWTTYEKDLKISPSHYQSLKDVVNIRKAELEGAQS